MLVELNLFLFYRLQNGATALEKRVTKVQAKDKEKEQGKDKERDRWTSRMFIIKLGYLAFTRKWVHYEKNFAFRFS